MASQENIVITGVGVVSPIGIGKDPFWAALSEGRSGIRRLDLPPNVSPSSAIGGAVADFDSKQYVRPRKSLKVMSRDIQLAFAAADMACVCGACASARNPTIVVPVRFPARHP